MDENVIAAARAAFPTSTQSVALGAVLHNGECHPEPLVSLPLGMLNRHGLIAGATGTGKTRTLQLIAEQLSRAGVPVFISDVKGDLSGIAAPGEGGTKITERASSCGYEWKPAGFPVEFLSLTGKHGAQLRATVSSFGPLLLSRVLGLNDTQTSVLAMVFAYCDDRGLLLLDFADLREVLRYLSTDGAEELEEYGGMSKRSVGVLFREMVALEQQGAESFFGEPAFEIGDLMRTMPDQRGLVSVLELQDVQDKPALYSTFLLWLLATLYSQLPEAGDLDKPKLVFFFDEAHLLFDGASKDLRDEVEKVVRLIRSKGVGIFFVTQSPKDLPSEVLGQLGNRVQHALRAYTADDDKALRAAARTFPRTDFYDIAETITTLGTGEAFVTVLGAKGVPTPPFAARMVPPMARMAPLAAVEQERLNAASSQVQEYARAMDRESAREVLQSRVNAAAAASADTQEMPAPRGADNTGRTKRAHKPARAEKGLVEKIFDTPAMKSATRAAATQVSRTLMGALLSGLGIKTRRR
jgi:DNA helicase HerA-like ATPase